MVKGLQLVVVNIDTVLLSFFLSRSVQYGRCSPALVSSGSVVLSVYFSCTLEEKWRTTSSELIGGGSARHLNTFSNLFIVAVHYTHINTCYVLLLLLTAPM